VTRLERRPAQKPDARFHQKQSRCIQHGARSSKSKAAMGLVAQGRRLASEGNEGSATNSRLKGSLMKQLQVLAYVLQRFAHESHRPHLKHSEANSDTFMSRSIRRLDCSQRRNWRQRPSE
jgi:hypothetical protein